MKGLRDITHRCYADCSGQFTCLSTKFLTTAKQTESVIMVTISLRSTFSGLLLLLFLGSSMSQPLSDLGRRADLINTTLQTATEYSRKVAHSSRPLPFQ
ncbi:hypothetical protein KEM48_013456 [Puccinia striiformis f. sp. tritici PST-130]|nr:hypothetical protein KEM48_013456 [Puccinia striiformis f. sp. tritici PST-130]